MVLAKLGPIFVKLLKALAMFLGFVAMFLLFVTSLPFTVIILGCLLLLCFNPIRPGRGYFYPTHQFIYDTSGNIDGINIIFCDFF